MAPAFFLVFSFCSFTPSVFPPHTPSLPFDEFSRRECLLIFKDWFCIAPVHLLLGAFISCPPVRTFEVPTYSPGFSFFCRFYSPTIVGQAFFLTSVACSLRCQFFSLRLIFLQSFLDGDCPLQASFPSFCLMYFHTSLYELIWCVCRSFAPNFFFLVLHRMFLVQASFLFFRRIEVPPCFA